jgi:hypothetical protein
MIKKLYLVALLSFFTSAVAMAQTTLDVNFNGLGFLDNREYKDFILRSRTYSGTRTALDFGLNIDTLNSFVVGANAIHEFGAKPYFLKVDPIAYYRFKNKNWLFHIGEFPREGLVDDYPRALLNDTLRYYRPNIEGMLVRFDNNKNFKETFWLDWVSRQTVTDREQFLFGMSGKYSPVAKGPFYISHYFLLLHDAGSASDANAITDNGGAQVKFGLDLSHHTFLDSLSFEAGGMMSIERTRGITGLHLPKGFIATAYLGWHWLALYDEFYSGQGSTIYYGDAFYEKKFYNRADFIFTPFVAKGLKGQFIFSVHRTPGYTSNQEAFRLTYDLGRRVIARFKD